MNFLWISGLAGSGNLALRSLFDSHPQILAFPFELSRTFRLVGSGLVNLRKRSWAEASTDLLRVILFDPTFEAYNRLDGAAFPLNTEQLISDVANAERGCFEWELFLRHLFAAYAKQAGYGDRTKYYCAVVDCSDFTWDDASLIADSKFIFPLRGWDITYQSHLNFTLIREGCSLSRFFRQKAVRYTSLLERACDGIRNNDIDSFDFNFEDLRQELQEKLTEICRWLDIEFDSSLETLTLMGIPEGGCTMDGKRIKARIAPAPSKYFCTPTSFEERFYRQGLKCDFPRPSPVAKVRMRFREWTKLAWHSAFQEVLPGELVDSFEYIQPETGEKWRNRREFLNHCKNAGWSVAEGRSNMKGWVVSRPIRTCLARGWLFLTFLEGIFAYALKPSPKYFSLHQQILLRLNLYFTFFKWHQLLLTRYKKVFN